VRILFVNEKASSQGGIEANVLDSARALAARGHAVALAHRDPAPEPAFRAAFAALYPLAPAGRGRRSPHLGDGLTAAAASFGAEVVYLHKVEDASDLDLERTRAPVVRMVHDHDLYCQRRHRYLLGTNEVCRRPADLLGCLRCGGLVERRRGAPLGLGWRPIWERLADLRATRRLACVLVASTAMRDELLRNGVPADRIRVLPLGVPWADPPPPRTGRTGPPRVLYVGQVLRTKGLDRLLRALAACRADWRLSVVGTGPQEREFRDLARSLGLHARTAWHGRLGPDVVARTMWAADLLAVPSWWPEPFGLVGLEGMRAGLPVVGFAAGGIPDWLDHERTGLLAPPGDVGALAGALDRLLTDAPLRERLGMAGRAAFEERFTMAGYIERLEATLREVCGEVRRCT
jgi:glycosyltransferase involved in cell wall biosynthesis